MTPAKLTLAGLALLLVVAQTGADDRMVLVQVKGEKDKKVSVTIYSDQQEERQSAISVDEAVKRIAEMKSWGKCDVYVTSDGCAWRGDVKKLLAAIIDNYWLNLEYFGHEAPKKVAGNFLQAGPKK
jgi:hypothetical protein